jgi:hypothetical protein
MKSLAVVAVLVFLAIGMSGQPDQTSKDKSAVPDNHHPRPVLDDSHDSYTYSQETPAKSNNESFHWNAAIKRPEWWAVGIALATLGLIFWQAKATAKAAIATEGSVIEMRRQVTASHDGLRAWIAGNVTEIEPVKAINPVQRRFRWEIKNYGQTPAFIKLVNVEYKLTDSPDGGETLKTPPRATNRFLGAGIGESNILTIRGIDLALCDARKKFWEVLIKVEYEDSFGRPHKTGASFSYYSPQGKGDPVARGFYQGTDPTTNYNT